MSGGPPSARARASRRRDRDDGVATVWAAVAMAVLTSVLVAGLHLGAAILARHRAEGAADLAALAAARQAVRGEVPACREAARIAEAAGAGVTRCRLVGWDALVEVRVPVAMALPGLEFAFGQAMAGPEPAPPQPGPPQPGPPQPGSVSGRSPPTDGPRRGGRGG